MAWPKGKSRLDNFKKKNLAKKESKMGSFEDKSARFMCCGKRMTEENYRDYLPGQALFKCYVCKQTKVINFKGDVC